jgi:glycolate oxidase iron-sulfur subunit
VIAVRASFPVIYGGHGYEKYLARSILAHPPVLAALRILGRTGAELFSRYIPAASGLRLRLALFQQGKEGAGCKRQDGGAAPVSWAAAAPLPSASPLPALSFFSGCTARYLFPEITASCGALMAEQGYRLHSPEGLSCCGLAALSAGDTYEARRCARNNIVRLEAGDGPILVSCASCFSHLRRYAELFTDDPAWQRRAERLAERVVELCCFLDQQPFSSPPPSPASTAGPEGAPRKIRVFYHDPCHFRHQLKITRQPRQVLARHPEFELLELAEGPQCCGQGGLFHIGSPKIATAIGERLAVQVLALRPEIITSTCSGCLMQWRMAIESAGAGSRVRVLHLAELVAAAPRHSP